MRGLDLLVELGVHLRNVDRDLLLACQLAELILRGAQLLDRFVRDVEGVEDLRFGDLVGARLDHQDPLARAGHDQVEIGARGQVLLIGVDDEVPIDLADPDSADGHRDRDVRDHQRR